MQIKRMFTALVLVAVGATAAAADYRHAGAERIVAMSDPHGAYDALLQTLANTGVVDGDGNWAGDATHLVITGDLLDRGAASRQIMDLVMRLETQAPAAGGKVLLTLGNHEVMNLVGDLRYVAAGEFAAFADEERMEDRERWFRIFVERRRVQTGDLADEATLRAEFDRDRPPGFYGHRRAFSSAGEYGRWLLGKPLMVVVNDTAFVHGGMPPLVAELGLEALNVRLGADVNDYVLALERLQDAGMIDPAVNFYDHGDIAGGILGPLSMDPSADPAIVQALETVVRLNDVPVHSPEGPLWYRGTVGCSVLAEGDVIAASLAAVGAERVVIGHTPTVTRRVLERFDGRVIEIDTGINKAAYGGSGFALVIEGGDVAVASQASRELAKPVRHPRRVGERVDSLSTDALEELLRSGDIVATETDEAGRTQVEVSRRGARVRALFTESPRRGEPELAAYELDRMIGLDLVPVTVPREVGGKRGTLTFLPADARDETFRAGSGQGGGAWCPLARQWNSLYVFDTLIGNDGRHPSNMLYSTGNWQLMSAGHGAAFGTSSGRPRYLAEAELEVTAAWAAALEGLTTDALRQELGAYLSKRQLSALEKRRDGLLAR